MSAPSAAARRTAAVHRRRFSSGAPTRGVNCRQWTVAVIGPPNRVGKRGLLSRLVGAARRAGLWPGRCAAPLVRPAGGRTGRAGIGPGGGRAGRVRQDTCRERIRGGRTAAPAGGVLIRPVRRPSRAGGPAGAPAAPGSASARFTADSRVIPRVGGTAATAPAVRSARTG